MDRIERFEDLIAWQKARVLTADIYRASGNGAFGKDFALRNQIRRASLSVMSNIAEGFERGNPGDFHRFLSVAKGSGGEVRSQLYVALDVGHLTEQAFQTFKAQAEEVNRIIGGLRSSVMLRRQKKIE